MRFEDVQIGRLYAMGGKTDPAKVKVLSKDPATRLIEVQRRDSWSKAILFERASRITRLWVEHERDLAASPKQMRRRRAGQLVAQMRERLAEVELEAAVRADHEGRILVALEPDAAEALMDSLRTAPAPALAEALGLV